MELLTGPTDAQRWSHVERSAGARIAFVPTMGALHSGHLRLVDVAREHGSRVVVSIFVNPAQFERPDDLACYPRPFEDDLELCRAGGVDAVYCPSAETMYPAGFQTYVEPGPLAQTMEGAARPGHFRGVTTVVAKLFLAVRPDVAVFGEKDYQQLVVVRRMTLDLDFGITIVGVPTVREPDGLALSSRNRLLSMPERAAARCVPGALQAAQAALDRGVVDGGDIVATAARVIRAEALARLDYAELCHPDTLVPIDRVVEPCVLALAVWVGDVRLIDNVLLRPPGPA